MNDGLVIHKDYADVGTCDSCECENVGRQYFPGQPMVTREKKDRMLCYICANTQISQHQLYTNLYPEVAPVTQAIAHIANIVLKVVKGVPLEDAPEDRP